MGRYPNACLHLSVARVKGSYFIRPLCPEALPVFSGPWTCTEPMKFCSMMYSPSLVSFTSIIYSHSFYPNKNTLGSFNSAACLKFFVIKHWGKMPHGTHISRLFFRKARTAVHLPCLFTILHPATFMK